MKYQVLTIRRFIDVVTLSHLNGVCNRYFLNHINKYSCIGVKTNIAEINVFTATEHEPKVKE